MKKILAVAAMIGTSAMFSVGAQAAVFSTVFAGAVYTADTPSANIGSATEQANQANPLLTSTPGLFTYTGPIDFFDPSGGTNTIQGFLNTGSGTTGGTLASSVGNQTLSTANFAHTSLFTFTFTTTSALSNVDILHDDGIALYKSTAPNTDLFGGSASSPTVATDATLASLAAGTYTLYYLEANGLPATLNFSYTPTTVPEPASLMLLGAGLCGIGIARRKRAI